MSRWDSGTKYKTSFDSIDEGLCVIKVLRDESGEGTDYVFLFNDISRRKDLERAIERQNEILRKRQLRRRQPQTRLIALTGWGQEDDKLRARQAGFDWHLTKPADLDTLHAILLG